MKNIPFVGLHAHSVAGSIFDAIGYPQDHMDFAYENGCDALALTDHGNMNGLAYQVLHARKMQAEGKNFKPIFGCEAYFIPSLDEWHEEYAKAMEDKKTAVLLEETHPDIFRIKLGQLKPGAGAKIVISYIWKHQLFHKGLQKLLGQ